MANWKYTLDIKDIWAKLENDELTPHEGAKLISAKLNELYSEMEGNVESYITDALSDIACDFEYMDEYATVDDFDWLMDDLYTWADPGHLCWVMTR